MQKILLILLFFLLSGCSLNNPFLSGEVDKVYVVKHSTYLKKHRAYFAREDLKPIKNGKKYLYLYNKKKKDLAILLHPKNQYRLYSLSFPEKKETVFKVHRNRRYSAILKKLRRKGYYPADPEKYGYITSTALRRYKGVKTILVEVKDYSKLLTLYKEAIRTYNAKKIQSVKTSLPKFFIASYYEKYRKRAKTKAQTEQLRIIGRKLKLYTPKPKVETPQKITENQNLTETHKTDEAPVERIITEEKPQKSVKPYTYYLHTAPYEELRSYLSEEDARENLTYNQYRKLKERLEEEELLREGSLEELISAYKRNKDPRYKSKIMLLMKKVHETQ